MTYETNSCLRISFWNCNGYPWNAGIGIDELTNDSDIILLAETWEHEAQRIVGFDKYNVHSLMWARNARQRRGQGGVACMIRKSVKNVSIVKEDMHKRYLWLKISLPDDKLIFVAGCYIPHHDSNFYACLDIDRDQPFVDLEEDIAQYKNKGEVIVFGDLNARTKVLQHDTQLVDMPHVSRGMDESFMYKRSSNDAKEPDHYGKSLLHMCNSTGMLIANGVSFWQGTNDFTCRKHNGDSVIDYMLFSEATLECIQSFTLGQWNPESDHRLLCIELKCRRRPEHVVSNLDVNQSSLRLDSKRAPIYADMVDQMLIISNHQESSTLECKWKVFKEVICCCAENCFSVKHASCKRSKKGSTKKKWFDTECIQARKHLLSLNVSKDKEAYLKHSHTYKALVQRKKRRWEVNKQILLAQEKANACGKFWQNVKGKRVESFGDLSLDDMYAHCKNLYEKPNVVKMECSSSLSSMSCFFTIEDVRRGLKKLATRKAGDLQGVKAEMLKWTSDKTHYWICDMFNLTLQQGMPNDWSTNWIKPLHKGGDVNNVNNYRTIMVGSLMAKLFGSIMEMKISEWAEKNGKRALGQAGFRKGHSTIDHLVTLRVLMEMSRLKGKKLYCCFVDFKKAFDMVPRGNLWTRMESLQVPREFMHAVFRVYQKVLCRLRMGNRISEFFASTIGVKQGCPLSPTLFGLLIDELERMILVSMQEEGIEEVVIGNAVIMLLLYADDVVLMAHTLEDAHKLMSVLERFCLHSGLIVNESKTKVMLVKTLNDEKPCIIYNNEQLETVDSFKYLGLEVPSNHKWKDCAMHRLEAGKRAYYAFENMCNVGDIKCLALKKYLFDTLVTPVLLYGVEVWGGSISKTTWREFENVQKRFLTNFFQVKTQTPYMLLLLESGSLSIEVLGMQRVVEYMLKIRRSPSHRLPRIAYEASQKVQKTSKSKILSSGWMLDIKKWFGRWNACHLVEDASTDSQVNEAFLQRQCIMAWEESGGSRFSHYTTYVSPNYKSLYFSERGNRTHPYILEPIPLSAIRTIASIRLSSHSLRCETGRWGTGEESQRLCTLCPRQVRETEFHTLLECSAFAQIRSSFPHIFSLGLSLHTFLSQPRCGLSIATLISAIFEHRESLMTSSHIT